MSGGGSGAPAAVSPTANTSTVQHASSQGSALGGKGGGFGGPPQSSPSQGFQPPQSQAIQFGGYGQQSPFGLTNPQTWGGNLGGVQNGNAISSAASIFSPTSTATTAPPVPAAPTPAAPVQEDNSNPFENTPTAGTIDTGAGTALNYDAGEQQAAQTIANTISEGGVNAATGDNNISAGPNVLSAGDDGVFGFGNDYNNEFQQNYAAQSAHAEANPYGHVNWHSTVTTGLSD